jgi:acetyl esterase/lipase
LNNNRLNLKKIGGSAMFAGFFSDWVLDWALANSAIIVSPDYRLLPESSGIELNEDIADIWAWLNRDLQAVLDQTGKQIRADMKKIAVLGDSAGGYLAVQLAIAHPEQIKVLVAMYPMLDLKLPYLTEKGHKPIFGLPMLPEGPVNEHIAKMQPDRIVTSAPGYERLQTFGFALVQQGRFFEFFGSEKSLFPMETIEMAKTFPPSFIFHGEADRAVPITASKNFVDKTLRLLPETKIHYVSRPGEDHGFDAQVNIEETWLKEGLEFATKYWFS